MKQALVTFAQRKHERDPKERPQRTQSHTQRTQSPGARFKPQASGACRYPSVHRDRPRGPGHHPPRRKPSLRCNPQCNSASLRFLPFNRESSDSASHRAPSERTGRAAGSVAKFKTLSLKWPDKQPPQIAGLDWREMKRRTGRDPRATGGGLTGEGPTPITDLGQRRPSPLPGGRSHHRRGLTKASNAGAHAEAICPLRRAVQFPAQRPCAATEREGSQSAAIYGFALRVSPLAPPPLRCGRHQGRPPTRPVGSRIAASAVRVDLDEAESV